MSDLLDLNSLSSDRFERICKALLEIDTGKSFHTYAEGADGGVDIRCFVDEESKIISQCKRYGRTSISKLFTELKNELSKVVLLNPTEYYLFISCDLTPANEDEIFGMFEKYMPHGRTEHIIHGKNIDDKLSKNKYRVICEENFDLFAKSKSVLDLGLNADIINDSKTLLEEIKENSKLFVKTKHYYEAADKFFRSRNILITGEPGIGKTFLSKMLVSDFLEKHKHAEFHYSSCKNLSSLKKLINNDPSVYELFYLDDFLGRAYFELKEESLNELKYLLKPILNSKRKYIILNSRRSVLNEANEKAKCISFSYDDSTFDIERINISELSYMDKGKILYNHMKVNELDKPRIEEIKTDDFYKTIIQHKSFSPRLIEFITTRSYYLKKDVSDYRKLIRDSLSNPKDIYLDDLNFNHKEVDRMFLYSLRSFDCLMVEENAFEDYFVSKYNELVKSHDDTICSNPYEECLLRLNDYYVKEVTSGRSNYLAIGNPSIYDFIDAMLANPSSRALRNRLMDSAMYVDQLLYLKHDFLSNKEEYVNWYKNNKTNYLTIKFPTNILKLFFYYYDDSDARFDVDEFISFLLDDKKTFTYEHTGVSGRQFYLKLFKRYNIDYLLCKEGLDCETIRLIVRELSQYFDWNDLCYFLKKTVNCNKNVMVHFARFICNLLFDEYMDNVDLPNFIESPSFTGNGNKDMIKNELEELLANELVASVKKNLDKEWFDSFNLVINILECAREFAQKVDFTNELEAYLNIDDDSHVLSSARNRDDNDNEEKYIDILFENI